MMRLGYCTSYTNIEAVEKAGFDYIELNLASAAEKTEDEFALMEKAVNASSIKAEAFNGMLPSAIHVTGEQVNETQIREYLDLAFSRAKRLGGKVIVCGASRSRSLPEGFNTAKGWRQFADYLRVCQEYAEKYDLVIAIEPLDKKETNLVNFVTEATLLASLLQLPRVGVLGDTYHMAMDGENFSSLTMAGNLLWHVHTAHPTTRQTPRKNDGGDYEELFRALRGIGYEGRISVEGRADDLTEAVPAAFEVLNALRRQS